MAGIGREAAEESVDKIKEVISSNTNMVFIETPANPTISLTDIAAVEGDPLYGLALGLAIALSFAWLLGLGATLAEPALNALGLTVETLTNGAFRKQVLMYAVSLGVGFGLAFGVSKIVFGFSIAWLLIPCSRRTVLVPSVA